ncbi:TerD family protein [Nocardia sp. CDC160]|uniref:TerD family protein n=1 Tax=Nocardia sp. CDC160 TaxID=3112166 RepID=UPI002DB59B4F|nr:TerD family protein [Nocardia sp. CDC160]MEC3916000.1 TerD family protein [Nocardia sp. CDC160]
MKLTKGGHTAVPTSLLTVVLSWHSGREVRAQAVLVAENGRARSDRDFVHFDAPRHVSQAVTVDREPEPGTARLSVSLPRTEAEVAGIVVIGSVAGGFAEVKGLRVTVFDHDRPVAEYEVATAESVPAMVVGEFTRTETDGWEFRAAAEGGVSLAGLVREFGVRMDPAREFEQPRRTAPPPNPERADWHPDPRDPARLRWWDATAWTAATRPVPVQDSRHCPRCGAVRRRRLFTAAHLCRECAAETAEYLAAWRPRAERILRRATPHEEWDTLWAALRYQRIDRAAALDLLRPVAHEQLERLVAFACADGVVEQTDIEDFEDTVEELSLTGPLTEDLRRRLHRGRLLTRLRSGELPLAPTTGLHLDPDERVHLNLPAAHIRQLARGPKRTEGRLIVSNRKLRFTGSGAGTEMPWARVVSVTSVDGLVEVSATSARGGALLEVADPDYVAAAMEGALRIAKRLALTPGRRDTRTIPPDVKAIVWQRDGGKCVECGERHYLEFDHIIPISIGGATSPANLQILCRACNRTKGAHL